MGDKETERIIVERRANTNSTKKLYYKSAKIIGCDVWFDTVSKWPFLMDVYTTNEEDAPKIREAALMLSETTGVHDDAGNYRFVRVYTDEQVIAKFAKK